MDFNNIMNMMEQQRRVLKDLEGLIAHDAKEAGSHSVNPKDLDVLKTYVSTMKTAVDTATTLAKHYKVAGATRTEQPAQEAKPEKEPAKKKGSTKKQDPPKEEPPAKDLPPEEEFDFLS